MDSLLANYASDDDEEQQEPSDPDLVPDRQTPQNPNQKLNATPFPPVKSILSSLPPPKSSSSPFLNLPPPKSAASTLPPVARRPADPVSSTKSDSCSLPSKFHSLPRPESKPSSSLFTLLPTPKPEVVPSGGNGKKVVQFRPPIDPSLFNSLDDDEDDERGDRKGMEKKPVSNSRPRSIASVLPSPQHSFSLVPSGRRTAIDANASGVSTEVQIVRVEEETGVEDCGLGGGGNPGTEDQMCYPGGWEGHVEGQWSSVLHCSHGDMAVEVPMDRSYHENYADCGGYWDHGVTGTSAISDVSVGAPALEAEVGMMTGKRRRDEIPAEILEVRQEELVKDRPREDQLKSTGIAFGPAYQSVSSAKGKPSKLHRRKHQIGSLYFDMRQKEAELTERRARGMLTKKETQGKYGW